MSEERLERLSKVAKELNIAVGRAVEFLNSKGFKLRQDPNAKLNSEQYDLLIKEFSADLKDKKEAISSLSFGKKLTETSPSVIEKVKPETKQEIVTPEPPSHTIAPQVSEVESLSKVKLDGPKVLGKIDLKPTKKIDVKQSEKQPTPSEPTHVDAKTPKVSNASENVQDIEVKELASSKLEDQVDDKKEPEISSRPVENRVLEKEKETANTVEPTQLIEAKADTLKGLTVLGKMQLAEEKPKKKEEPSPAAESKDEKKKRKRIKVEPKPAHFYQNKNLQGKGKSDFVKKETLAKEEITDKHIQEQIKNTLARLSGGNKQSGVNRAKYRKEKRSAFAEMEEERLAKQMEDAKVLKVTEFISANDLASMMNVSVNQIIGACMSLGMFISINQRLDAEAIQFIAEEFGYKAQFTTADDEIAAEEEEDKPEDLQIRPPIVTIMGHVDHGKTSLLDYIRKSNITAQEAGGITQHIGAYDVKTESGKWITFLDTPGHEAFTAMRARGAKVTDIVIIVVAADDGVMPQTKEAINHALVAGVPIIIAINKIDKPTANPDKIKEQLAQENILVEDWGGKYQCEAISAKSGKGIPELLEKVLLEAEMLDLKANPNKKAVGTVIEASLDKGRGYVTTLLVQSGKLQVGDVILAGQFFGKVRAMIDHKGEKLTFAGPSKPVQILGLPGAPQAGDKFNVMNSEAEAREIANKREQIIREQSIRTKKHITLDEIGRRLAIGNFKQLNIIIKGDVDGSIEALSDSLLKLSTGEIQISILHKGVGQITESDVLLASASDAIIVAFQVRPSLSAKKLAEQEQIEIRMYSIIYDVINDIKDAMEGMLAPTFEETIIGMAEIKEVFKIGKVGTIAGCMVIEGKIKRSNEVRVVRDGIVVHTGTISSLKRFKEDASEIQTGQDCGLGIQNFSQFQIGDTIEAFEKKEVKRKL